MPPVLEPQRLTPSQAASLLDISTRTLSRRALAFEISLSEGASRRGRKRSFDGEDISTLRRAQDLMDRGMTIAEVAEILSVRPSNDESHPIVLSPESNIALGTALERTKQIGDELHDQDTRIDRLEKWLREPWYRRLFGRPPE